jgi:glycerophosphoryl diester phosphodiesterase
MPELEPPVGQRERLNGYADQARWLRIPQLKDVLEAVSPSLGIYFIIEFKQDSEYLIKEVCRLLESTGHKANVYWFSLVGLINRKLQIADPSIHCLESVPGMLKLLGLYYIGLLPFLSIDCDVLGLTIDDIPLSRVQNESAFKGLPSFIHLILAFLFQGKPPAPMNAPALFRHLRKRGIPVWFLNVNREDEVHIAVAIGATGVLTDKINWLAKYVKDQKIQFEKISL